MSTPADDPRFVAAVDLVGRAGAESFQIRCDEEQDPLVWVAVGLWGAGFPGGAFKGAVECAAGKDPLQAVLRLLALVVNGGWCTHCGRSTLVSDDWSATSRDEQHCWYVFDPEVKTFRRSCEGDTQYAPTGRNDPCPCGSGLKYKRCCGA